MLYSGEAGVREDEGFDGSATAGTDRDEEERHWEGHHAPSGECQPGGAQRVRARTRRDRRRAGQVI